ncbi:MAG: 23S rRNA (adenine(2503)-C(2))-methyltransferase RlmN [Myxococcota bacterium]|nr:23S rRNA (adenine(2503)-C(2))-methyltransferase RlmN [Myxococcota bacterium]
MSEPIAQIEAPEKAPAPPSKRVDLLSLSQEKLTAFVGELGEKPFRAKQIFKWLHQRGVTSFSEMTDLSKSLRQTLEERAEIIWVHKDLEQRSVDGTIKYRFRTRDGKLIESVYMPSPERKTLCVSTQVGCAMGCTFCATGTLGLLRNLTPGEIVSQVHAVNREVRANEGLEINRPLTNLVFMGMGEPLHNFTHLKVALENLQSVDGPNFSHRHITVSTVGLVPMIARLGAETEVKLAISLNATTDEQRSATMPINKRWKIADLIEACKAFPMRQGRRITFEYVLLSGVNDTDEDAYRLAEIVKDLPAKVNLIPYNENPGLGFKTTSGTRAEAFRALLDSLHVAAFIRQNRGRDISAACGQLANVVVQPAMTPVGGPEVPLGAGSSPPG